jgi:hypothetical protein
MTASRNARRVLLALGLLFLAGLGWLGLSGGVEQFSMSRSLIQWAQSMSQLAYGILSVAAIVAVLRRRRWKTAVLRAWTVAVTLAAGLAPVAWGGLGLSSGLMAGGGTLLIALAIIWLVRPGSVPGEQSDSDRTRSV